MGFHPFRWIGKHAYNFICDRCFEKVDIDQSGFLELVEIEVAVLYLYNMVNKRLPGWEDPPSRQQIMDAMVEFDKDGNKKLDKLEFREFIHAVKKSGPDAFFSRIGKNMAVTTVAAWAVKSVAGGTPIAGVPLALMAPILGTVFKSVRGALPF